MALTKVKLIADGVVDVDHLAANHGITTDNIGEGTALYYTDARVSLYLTTNSYATEGFVTTAVSNLVASAPETLDTLNELAAALGDDPNFATTVTNSIATKLPLAGGTLTGGLNIQTTDDTRLTLSDTTDSSNITVRADLTNSIYSNKSLNIYTENADHISFSTNGQTSEAMRIDSSGNLFIQGTRRIYLNGASNYVYSPDGSDLDIGSGDDINFRSSYMRFFNASTNYEYARLHGEQGDSWINANGGRVGIGTNTPTQTLHAYGTIYTNDGNFKIDSGYELSWGNGNTSILGNTSTNFLDFRVNNAPKMIINSSGNIGIGTTLPSYKLDVNGNSRFISDINTGAKINFTGTPSLGNPYTFIQHSYNGGGNCGIRLIAHNPNNGVDSDLEFQVMDSAANYVTPLYLDGSTNSVGIGTNSPTARLDVNSGATNTVAAFRSTDAGAYVGFADNTSTLDAGYPTTSVGAIGDNLILSSANAERMRITSGGTAIINSSIPLNFTNTGTGTYNKTVIYNDQSNGLLIEGPIATDSYSGTKLPLTLTWRGGIGQGGLKLNGNTQLFTDDTGLGIDNSSPSAKLTVSAGGTNEFAESIWGNYNSQGSAARHTIVRHYPVVSSGTRLEFPFISQGNLNCSTIVKVWGHGARWNTKNHTAFTATFAVGHLLSLGYLQLLESSGNVSSLTSSGMTVYLNFTSDYTSATANGVYVTIEYMTSVRSYSLDTANITMN